MAFVTTIITWIFFSLTLKRFWHRPRRIRTNFFYGDSGYVGTPYHTLSCIQF